jgi:outer membrane receptor protein involved in Fe transport
MTFAPRDRTTFRLATSYTDSELQTYDRNNDIGSPMSITMAAKPERATCEPSSVDPDNMFGESTPMCTGQGNPWGALTGTPREWMQKERTLAARHFSASVNGSWEGGPGLFVRGLVGLDQVDEAFDRTTPFGWKVDGVTTSSTTNQGVHGIENRVHRELTLDGRIGWSTDLGSDFRSELVFGGQRFFSESTFQTGLGAVFPAPGIEVFQAGEVTNAQSWIQSKVSLGLFVQEQLGFRDWLFTTVGARFDRTSAFGKDADGAIYPKAGVSAVVSELDAWPLDWLPTLRLRAAVGRSGLQPGVFDESTTFFAGQTPAGGGIFAGNLGNPLLVPERSTELEFGLDGEVADGRVGFDVTYWDRTTEDALIARHFPAAGGFVHPQLDNVGQLDAQGWEVQLNALALDRDALTLNLFANAAYMSEIVTSMGGAPVINVSGTYTRHRNVIDEGLAPGTFVGAGLIPECGSTSDVCFTPGSTVPFDSNGDGLPDDLATFRAFLGSMPSIGLGDPRLGPMLRDDDGDGDLRDNILGKPTPDWQGSLGANLTLGSHVSLNTLFEYRAGNYYVSNLTRAFRNAHPAIGTNTREVAEVESTLLNPATQGDVDARLAAAIKWANELAALFPYSGLNQIEHADFVRWREVSLTYRLPQGVSGRAGLGDVTVSVTGRNLTVWTRYGGVDPEANEMSRCGGGGEAQEGVQCNFLEATETFNLPLPQRFGVSVRVVF